MRFSLTSTNKSSGPADGTHVVPSTDQDPMGAKGGVLQGGRNEARYHIHPAIHASAIIVSTPTDRPLHDDAGRQIPLKNSAAVKSASIVGLPRRRRLKRSRHLQVKSAQAQQAECEKRVARPYNRKGPRQRRFCEALLRDCPKSNQY
jgi:hypothetical protein